MDNIKFIDSFARNAAPAVAKYRWNVDIAEAETNATSLKIDSRLVVPNKVYTASLTVSDAFGRSTVSNNFNFNLHSCGSFYDFDTELAFIQKDLLFERGSEEFKFKFGATSCRSFVFNVKQS